MLIRNILFDLDGTLFDTQTFHAEAESELMKARGVSITAQELTLRFAGRPTSEVFREILGCDDATAHALTRRKWEKIIPRAAEAKPLADLPELFLDLDRKGFDFGIGSSSPRDWVWKLIELHCLRHYFTPFNVVCGDEVTNGKPDPEVWDRLARGIQGKIPPENCLVVEDGLAGIEGALAAGMHCALLLPTTHPKAASITNVRDVLTLL